MVSELPAMAPVEDVHDEVGEQFIEHVLGGPSRTMARES